VEPIKAGSPETLVKAPTPEDLERAGEIRFEFFRSSGPGGQNVNKVATAARLRWDVLGSRLLPDPIQPRLARLAGKRMTARGVLVIEAQRFRTQERNRVDALERLEAKRRRSRLKGHRQRKVPPED